MIATIVNSISIILGGMLGLILKKGFNEKVSERVMQGLSLCVLCIGVSGMIKSSNFMVIIISIVIGAFIGETIDIDKHLENLGKAVERKFKRENSKLSEGFVYCTLLYCIGAMSIIGSLESGLSKNYTTLFTKSMLDGISAIIFSSTLGIGVLLSSISVFLYQGTLTIFASALKPILTDAAISDLTSLGSILIFALSLNMLEIKKIKVANFLPSILVLLLYYVIITYIKNPLF